MKNITKLLTLSIFIFTAAMAYAQSGGSTALPFLKMDMGARYYGMAGAATAFGGDAGAMAVYNPAAAGRIKALQLTTSTFENTLDMKHHYLAAAFPVKFLSLSGVAPTNVGLSLLMFDKGNIDFNGVNMSIGDDMAFTLTLGEEVARHTWDFMGSTSDVSHYLGVNARYISSQYPYVNGLGVLSGDVTGKTYSFDAGYLVSVEEHFGFAVAARNLGPQIKYQEERDPLPSTLAFGAFLTLADVNDLRWDISGDYIWYLKEKEERLRLGTEAVFFDILAVRAGAKLLEEIKAEYTLGFGLRLLGIEADFGMVLNPQINGDNVYQAGISYKFPVAAKKDNYDDSSARERENYQDYRQQTRREAQRRAEMNTNPILYQ